MEEKLLEAQENVMTETLETTNFVASNYLPNQDTFDKLAEHQKFFEENYDEIQRNPEFGRKKNWPHMPWAIAYSIKMHGKQYDALAFFIAAIILKWDALVEQLTRTLKNFSITKADLQEVLEKVWTPNLQNLSNMARKAVDKAYAKTESISEDFELEKTTPYMLRNDGELLKCGDVHPYVKVYFNGSYEENLAEFLKHPNWIEWFANNTRNEEVKQLLLQVQENASEDVFNALNDKLNQEFCKVRTTNIKYKYGADNGEIYFRICSNDENWFEVIWNTVMRFADQIKFVTIVKDYQTFGKQFEYCEYKGKVFNKMPVDEFLTLEGNPIIEEVEEPLEEDIEKHTELNPKLFENNKLKPEVRERILACADELISLIIENNVKFTLKDILIIGSNASYNYTKDSDLDVHLITATSDLQCPDNLYPIVYDAYRSLFNKKFDINFYGISVEFFIENEETPTVSNGIYSVLNDTWVKEPTLEEIPDVDQDAINVAFAPWEKKYNDLVATIQKSLETEPLHESFESTADLSSIIAPLIKDEWEAVEGYQNTIKVLETNEKYTKAVTLLQDISREEEVHVGELQKLLDEFTNNTISNIIDGQEEAETKLSETAEELVIESLTDPRIVEITKLIEEIYAMRTAGLAKGSEYSIENLVFKEFRNRGYLDNLKLLKNKIKSQMLSLGE